MTGIRQITIEGFKSIRLAKIDLGRLNVLIGANGAGKSNFVSFFDFILLSSRSLTAGWIEGGESLFYRGTKNTQLIRATFVFADSGEPVKFQWEYTGTDVLSFGHPRLDAYTLLTPEHLSVFQFHDTSRDSRIRRAVYVDDNRRLLRDGGNLAAFLYRLRKTRSPAYRRIVETIRQVAPFFDDFDIEPIIGNWGMDNQESVRLNWRERGSDYLLGPHQLSDGTLRAMALIALLLQPEAELPEIIVIDEPELGLHPAALGILGSLLRSASVHSQIIVATQSVQLVNLFTAEDIIVADRTEDGTKFSHLRPDQLHEWLEEYSLGELWEKNVIGGSPFL
jgi:predicted ATPase